MSHISSSSIDPNMSYTSLPPQSHLHPPISLQHSIQYPNAYPQHQHQLQPNNIHSTNPFETPLHPSYQIPQTQTHRHSSPTHHQQQQHQHQQHQQYTYTQSQQPIIPSPYNDYTSSTSIDTGIPNFTKPLVQEALAGEILVLRRENSQLKSQVERDRIAIENQDKTLSQVRTSAEELTMLEAEEIARLEAELERAVTEKDKWHNLCKKAETSVETLRIECNVLKRKQEDLEMNSFEKEHRKHLSVADSRSFHQLYDTNANANANTTYSNTNMNTLAASTRKQITDTIQDSKYMERIRTRLWDETDDHNHTNNSHSNNNNNNNINSGYSNSYNPRDSKVNNSFNPRSSNSNNGNGNGSNNNYGGSSSNNNFASSMSTTNTTARKTTPVRFENGSTRERYDNTYDTSASALSTPHRRSSSPLSPLNTTGGGGRGGYANVNMNTHMKMNANTNTDINTEHFGLRRDSRVTSPVDDHVITMYRKREDELLEALEGVVMRCKVLESRLGIT